MDTLTKNDYDKIRTWKYLLEDLKSVYDIPRMHQQISKAIDKYYFVPNTLKSHYSVLAKIMKINKMNKEYEL